MDREANLPVSQDRAPKNLVRPILNQDTSSSSSFSSPEFLRHVQAAFKRHRPLSKMQTRTIGPRRSVASQREASRSSGLAVASKAEVKRSQDVVSLSLSLAANNLAQETRNITTGVAGESLENASITPPSISGAITKNFDENFNPLDRQMDESMPDVACKESNLHMESQNRDGHRKVQSLIGNSLTSSQDMEWDATNQAEAYNFVAHNESRHQNFRTVESEINFKSESGVSSSLGKIQGGLNNFHNFLNQPVSQCSVVGSSCATTTSIHSSSAPMLNPTTNMSCSYVEGNSNAMLEPSANSNANPRAIQSQGDMMHSLHSSSKDINNNMQVDKSVEASKMPASAIDRGVEVKDPDNSKQRHNTTESEIPMASSSYQRDVLPTNAGSQPSKSDKQEKVANNKEAAAPRRRNYDPDLFFKVNGKLYQRLGKIGSGGSSEVHKVISSDCNIYALKKIKLKGRDYATSYGFCQEIGYLKKLKGKNNIIQLIDYEVTDKTLLGEVMKGTMSNRDGRVKDDGYIYMVLEYGEIDLAHMLSQKWKEIEGSNRTIDANWLRFYWQQILQAVNTIHEERIVHSDLKPANFLLVRGSLKLIDFGIAKAINSDTTNIQRDSQVGTLSYMSPEAFMCNENDANGNTIKCGRPSDIWSLGCILYQMVYGRTPFSDYKSFWSKFKVITDPNHEITYPPVSNPWLLDLMKKCLAWDRNQRWRIPQLLEHPFLAPPIPIPPNPPRDQSIIKLLDLVAESCGSDETASSMASQLRQLLADPRTDVLASNDSLCQILSRVSELCSLLQERLQSPVN
ncbi:PREDICTED: probable serine/threonine-protein kinase mps1 [Tarenaya hassleriana]|uniref:probable serine/threonine-protein kinase mps1 n=1 Tax=Tarenaya hassleriana TaxID=28532 RepID=UPI00053CA6B5|nr:PREDICTED: probable serine/threonine-protein kinase mps1 [Tarenaya hassleriana]